MGGKEKLPEVSKKVGPPQTPRSPDDSTSGSESGVPRSRSKDDADKSESKIKKRSSRSASVTSGDKVRTDLVGLLKKPPPIESSPIPPSTEPSNALLQELWKTSKSNSESIAKMADVMKCLTEQQIVEEPEELQVYLWETSRKVSSDFAPNDWKRLTIKSMVRKYTEHPSAVMFSTPQAEPASRNYSRTERICRIVISLDHPIYCQTQNIF